MHAVGMVLEAVPAGATALSAGHSERTGTAAFQAGRLPGTLPGTPPARFGSGSFEYPRSIAARTRLTLAVTRLHPPGSTAFEARLGCKLVVPGALTGLAYEINMAVATAAAALQCPGAPATAAKTCAVRVQRTDQVLPNRHGFALITRRAVTEIRAEKEANEVHISCLVGGGENLPAFKYLQREAECPGYEEKGHHHLEDFHQDKPANHNCGHTQPQANQRDNPVAPARNRRRCGGWWRGRNGVNAYPNVAVGVDLHSGAVLVSLHGYTLIQAALASQESGRRPDVRLRQLNGRAEGGGPAGEAPRSQPSRPMPSGESLVGA